MPTGAPPPNPSDALHLDESATSSQTTFSSPDGPRSPDAAGGAYDAAALAALSLGSGRGGLGFPATGVRRPSAAASDAVHRELADGIDLAAIAAGGSPRPTPPSSRGRQGAVLASGGGEFGPAQARDA